MLILIIVKNIEQIGINVDAKIIKNLLINHDVRIVDNKYINTETVFDYIIMIEHIFSNMFETLNYKKIIYIPNCELLTDWDIKNIHKVDIIIAKTKIVRPYLESLDLKLPDIIYTKFTTPCHSLEFKKNKNIVVHFAGSSFMKNTTAVLKTWVKNNYFLKENPNIILVITKKKWFQTEIEKEGMKFWDSLKPTKVNNILDRKVSAFNVKNIFITEFLEKDDYEFFSNSAFMYLCPSLMEGYGHYINDGRCRKSLVLTTDAEPMNELITEKKQLIKVEKKVLHYKDHFNKWIYKTNYKSNRVSIEDFGNKIKYFIKNDIEKYTHRQYKEYTEDTQFFNKTMSEIFESD